MHQLEVHRLVAATWIGDIVDMDVHHKNHNKTDPRVRNLEISTQNRHGIHHNRGENNSTSKFTDENVHEICQLLVDGVTCREIAFRMTDKLKTFISVESIEKISCKKNWTHISDQYDIKPKVRETMGEFTDMRFTLAKMVINDGLSIREIADRIGIPYKDVTGKISKPYMRLSKCIPRYVEKYQTTTDMLEPKPGGRFDQFKKSRSGRHRNSVNDTP